MRNLASYVNPIGYALQCERDPGNHRYCTRGDDGLFGYADPWWIACTDQTHPFHN